MRNFKSELAELTAALRTLRFWWVLGLVAVGCLLFSTVIHGILIPQNFYSAGITGLALLLHDFLGGKLSISEIYLLLNIPIFVVGYREFALKFLVASLLGMAIFATMLELMQGIVIPTKDPLLAAILGGVLSGGGTGLYLRFGGSVGGLDIVGSVLKKRFALPIGVTFNFVNFMVLATNALLYELDYALYTGIFIFVFSWTMQRVITGFSQRRSVFIISDHPEEVLENVIRPLDRGATYFLATGTFRNEPKRVIYTVINLFELGRLKAALAETDPEAFVAVQSTEEVIGSRFLTWEDEGFRPERSQPHSSAQIEV